MLNYIIYRYLECFDDFKQTEIVEKIVEKANFEFT